MPNTSREELVVITGGTRGIGLAIADSARERALGRIVLVSRAAPAASRFSADDRVVHIAADLSTSEGVAAAASRVLALEAPVRILVNNAGQIFDKDSLAEIDSATLSRAFQLHVITPTTLTKALLPRLSDATAPSVINIGSIYGNAADADVYGYALTKSAVPLLTQMLARTYGPMLRVNCVLPGHINTDMTRAAPPEFILEITAKTPAGRLGSASEVADLVLFLASDEARFITGATVRIDGGYWSSSP